MKEYWTSGGRIKGVVLVSRGRKLILNLHAQPLAWPLESQLTEAFSCSLSFCGRETSVCGDFPRKSGFWCNTISLVLFCVLPLLPELCMFSRISRLIDQRVTLIGCYSPDNIRRYHQGNISKTSKTTRRRYCRCVRAWRACTL